MSLQPYLIADLIDERFVCPNAIITRKVQTINHEFDGKIGVRLTPGDPTSYKEIEVSKLKNIKKQKKNLYLHHAILKSNLDITRFPVDMLHIDSCQIDVMSDQDIDSFWNDRFQQHRFPKDKEIKIVRVNERKLSVWNDVYWFLAGWELKQSSVFVLDKSTGNVIS